MRQDGANDLLEEEEAEGVSTSLRDRTSNMYHYSASMLCCGVVVLLYPLYIDIVLIIEMGS